MTRPLRTPASEALEKLVETRGRALLGSAYLLTLDIGEAEDLLQDALVKVFAGRRTVASAALEAYVRRAILTLYIDRSRRTARFRVWSHIGRSGRTEESGPGEFVPSRVDVLNAIRQLPPQQRACIVLRYYEDIPVHEIAELMNVGEGTVKRYLSLGRHRLAGFLAVDDTATEASNTTTVLER